MATLRRTRCTRARFARPGEGVGIKSRKVGHLRRGHEPSQHRRGSRPHWPRSHLHRAIAGPCQGDADERGLGRHAVRDLGHTCSRCPPWRFPEGWTKGRRGAGEDTNGLHRAEATSPGHPRARARGANRNRCQESGGVGRLAFERRPPEVGGRSLQMTRRGGARGGRTPWPGLRTQSS